MTRHLFTGFQTLSPPPLLHRDWFKWLHIDDLTYWQRERERKTKIIRYRKVNQFSHRNLSFSWKEKFSQFSLAFIWHKQRWQRSFFSIYSFSLSLILSCALCRTLGDEKRRENRTRTLLACLPYTFLCTHTHTQWTLLPVLCLHVWQASQEEIFLLSLFVCLTSGREENVCISALLACSHTQRPTDNDREVSYSHTHTHTQAHAFILSSYSARTN